MWFAPFSKSIPLPNVACPFTLTLSHTYQAIDLLDEAGAVVHMEIPYDASGKMISSGANLPQVTEHTVADVVSQWSNVPIGKIESEETDRLMVLESEITQRVKGQARAVRSVSRAVRRARSGLRDQSRPIASFMFCGPTVSGRCFSSVRLEDAMNISAHFTYSPRKSRQT